MPVRKTERRLRRCDYAGVALFALTLIVGTGPVSNHAKQQKTRESPVQLRVVDLAVEPGDTLLTVLRQFDMRPSTASAMIEALRPFVNPRNIKAGQRLQVILNPQDGKVQGLKYPLPSAVVKVVMEPKGWYGEHREISSVRKTRVARGIVDGNFYQSAREAGLAASQILEVADIFRYDIDFFSDFRRGDRFSIAFEELSYTDGRTALGRVVAADLTAGGNAFRAFYYPRHEGKGAYYDMDGRSLHGAFLRSPVDYQRISSPYTPKRRHPIFQTVRPHRGIDYAAPSGTPVMSVGRGVVSFIGRRKGYGKLVEIQHSKGYTTRYSHLSRIASDLRRGEHVDQGNVIGRVGQTGVATGPNLHFEILRGGKKVNFLKLRLRRQRGLAGAEFERFTILRDQRLTLLQRKSGQALLSSLTSSKRELNSD